MHKLHLTLLAAIVVLGLAATGAQSARAQTYNVLYSFTGEADGAYSFAPLVLDATGNLYGTTEYGGSHQYGAVFMLDSSGTETVLYSFNVAGTGDGEFPFAGLVLDGAGNVYGTTQFGGTHGSGTVFKVDTSGNETVLHSFTGGSDGANPRAGLVWDAKGNLYGTTFRGGSTLCTQGCGVVFKLDVQGKETVLYTFTGSGDGANPSSVILDKAGNLYGTTLDGEGAFGSGTVFKLSKSGKKAVLHRFGVGAEGYYPYAPLVLDAAGNLYGTTQAGGVAYGTVFKLNTSGKKFAVLHSFTGGALDGAQPFAPLVLDAAGNLYGTTYWGGTSNAGTIFKVDKNGAESVLHNFAGGTDGAYPYAGLVQDAGGNLYGTTEYGGGASIGGASGYGTVFKLTP